MRAPRLVVALSLAAALAGCSAATDDQGQPSGDVPTETVTVYLAVAKACSISDGDATFSPLLVEGDGYSTTIEPTEDCAEQRIFSTYVYDVPIATDGNVEITPGNQPTATLEVADLLADDGATVFYGREGEGEYAVTVIAPGRDDEVGDAGLS